jgi:hypothetical protein
VNPRAALIFALLGAVPVAARAQRGADPALAHLRSGALVRVVLVGGARFEGHLGSVTADSILLINPTGERWIAVAQVGELDERRSSARAGAKIGAVTGGLVGAGALGVACYPESSPEEGGKGYEWIGCAAIGGIIGGGLEPQSGPASDLSSPRGTCAFVLHSRQVTPRPECAKLQPGRDPRPRCP